MTTSTTTPLLNNRPTSIITVLGAARQREGDRVPLEEHLVNVSRHLQMRVGSDDAENVSNLRAEAGGARNMSQCETEVGSSKIHARDKDSTAVKRYNTAVKRYNPWHRDATHTHTHIHIYGKEQRWSGQGMKTPAWTHGRTRSKNTLLHRLAEALPTQAQQLHTITIETTNEQTYVGSRRWRTCFKCCVQS